MRPAHLGPEFAHATCDAIRIIIQLLRVLERDDIFYRRSGKPAQVKLLPAGDYVDHLTDQLLVGGGKLVQRSHRIFRALQKSSLRQRALLPREFAKIQWPLVLSEDAFAQKLQCAQP